MDSQRGQAAPEYIGTLAVIALVLVGGGAVAKPDLASAVARQARTALCIVGGDVCRHSDAVAAGLEPCVVGADSRTRRTGLTILFLRSGEEEAFTVQRRSDGSVVLTEVEGKDLGAGARADLPLGPVVRAEAGAAATLRWRSGRVWEFPSEAALERAMERAGLAGARYRAFGLAGLAPTAEYFAGGADLSASLAGSLLGAQLPVGTGVLGETLGRRARGSETTYYVDARGFAPRMLGGLAKGVRAWTLEVSADGGRARELVLRGVRDGRRSEEITARLDLDAGANRAAARDLLGLRPPWTPLELARLAAVGRHLLVAGTVERHVFEEQELDGRDWSAGVGIVGFDHATAARRRTLVAATLLGPDGRVRRRLDCVATQPADRV